MQGRALVRAPERKQEEAESAEFLDRLPESIWVCPAQSPHAHIGSAVAGQVGVVPHRFQRIRIPIRNMPLQLAVGFTIQECVVVNQRRLDRDATLTELQ